MNTILPGIEEGVTVQRRTKLIPDIVKVKHFLSVNSATCLSDTMHMFMKRRTPVRIITMITETKDSKAKGLIKR